MGGQGFIFKPSASSVALNPLSAALTLCYHDTWDLLGTYLGPTWDLLGTYLEPTTWHMGPTSPHLPPIIQTGPFKARDPGNLAWNSGESHFCLFWGFHIVIYIIICYYVSAFKAWVTFWPLIKILLSAAQHCSPHISKHNEIKERFLCDIMHYLVI